MALIFDTKRDMAAAEDEDRGGRNDRLDVDIQNPSADHPGPGRFAAREIVVNGARLFIPHDHDRLGDDLSLQAAAADASQDGPILADEHFGARLPRGGALGADDGGQRRACALGFEPHDLLVQIRHHASRIGTV
jgi:hypothetical protein